MRQTKGAIGNLLNRYKAVLKKCHLLNTFGSLAVAGMLVMGGVGVAADVQANVLINGEAISTESGNPATLFDAIIEAQDGDVITLTNSHSGGGLPTKVNNVDKDFKTKGLTIDLNENTYTITDPSVGSAGTETNGAQLLRDNIITIKNGTIISDGASFSTAILIQNYSNLTLENVILDGTNLKDHQSGNYTLSNNFGNINIKNSTIIAKEGGIAFDVYYGLSSSYTAEGVSVNVEDATITGKIEVTIDNNVTELAEGAKHELTLSGGKLTGNLTAGNGAQLENWGKTTISNVAIENNTASDKGGAIYNSDNKTGAQGELALNNVSLTGNKASFGGALWNDGTANISGKDFTGNNATSAGGAIYNNTDATLVLDGVTFERNTSAKSGAINNYDGTVTITGSQFKNNSADTGMGGAISNVSGKTDKVGTIKIVNSEFAGNNGGNGGAIWQGTEGSISITGSTFTNNTAVAEGSQQQGGAITNASNMEISSTTFDGNRAGGIGGAIANVVPQGNIGDGPNLQLSDVTVRNNWAGTSGGGIYNGAGNSIDLEGSNDITDNTSGTDGAAKADDLYNAGAVNVNSGTTTVDALTNSGNINVGGAGSTATFAVRESWTQETGGTMTVDNLGTLAVDSSIVLREGVDTSVYAATVNAGGTYRVDGLTGTLDTETLTALSTLLGAGSEGQIDVGAAKLDFVINDHGHYDYAANQSFATFVNDESLSLTTDVASTTAPVNGGFEKVHLTSGEELTAGNLTLAGTETGTKLVYYGANEPNDPNAQTGDLRVGVYGTTDSGNVTLGLADKNNRGELRNVILTGTAGKEVTLNVRGAGSAEFTVETFIVGRESETKVVIDGATLKTTGFSADPDHGPLDTAEVSNGTFAATEGNMNITDVVLSNNGRVTAQSATDAEEGTQGNIDILGTVHGSGSVIAQNTLSFDNDANVALATDTNDNLTLQGKTVEFNDGLDSSSAGTVHVVATDTLNTKGDVALEGDTIWAEKWNPTEAISATDSLIQIGQFGEAETGSVLNESVTLDGSSLLVHGDTSEEALNEAREAMADAGITGSTYYARDTMEVGSDGVLHLNATENQTSGSAIVFGSGSMLIVDSNVFRSDDAPAVFTSEGDKTAVVSDGSTLYAVNAQYGDEFTVFGDKINASGTWGDILADTPMLKGTYDEETHTVSYNDVQDPVKEFPGLSGDMAQAVYDLYVNKLNKVNDPALGVRFLSRATNDAYLGGTDRRAAASTIESAARMAFAAAVPQMTKMASDSATDSVVNRMGFANPENGAKAMNVDGKLVDDKALGLALWIAPLWSNQTGFGMEAGNLDYGYNANLGGISLGADYTWANNFRAGLMFNIGGGYAESAGGDLSETTNSMTFWGVGAYGGWKYENFAVMGDVSYTSTWNSVDQDLDHRMGMGDLESDIQSSAISAGLRFEYKLETQYLDLIPHVGARYMSINTWGYDVEANGGTVMEGDGFQQNIWTFPVGITFSKELEMNNDWYFKPSVDFTVIPAAGDIKAKEDVLFTGMQRSYEVETQMMDYFTWQGGLGLEFGSDNMSVGVNYTLQAGQNSTGHGVFGMFRYEF